MLFDSDHAGDKIFGEVRAPLTVRQEPPDLAILREALALLHLNWRQYAHGSRHIFLPVSSNICSHLDSSSTNCSGISSILRAALRNGCDERTRGELEHSNIAIRGRSSICIPLQHSGQKRSVTDALVIRF